MRLRPLAFEVFRLGTAMFLSLLLRGRGVRQWTVQPRPATAGRCDSALLGLSQNLKASPPWVDGRLAAAVPLIEVCSTLIAKALAVLLAERGQWEFEDHRIADHGAQIDQVTLEAVGILVLGADTLEVPLTDPDGQLTGDLGRTATTLPHPGTRHLAGDDHPLGDRLELAIEASEAAIGHL